MGVLFVEPSTSNIFYKKDSAHLVCLTIVVKQQRFVKRLELNDLFKILTR